MASKFKAEDTAFIVESNRIIREVEVRSCAGGMYLLRFKDSDGGIKLKEHRLFATKEEAEASIPGKKTECRTGTLEEYLPGVEKYLEEKRHKVSVREKLKEKKAAVQANDEKANNARKVKM